MSLPTRSNDFVVVVVVVATIVVVIIVVVIIVNVVVVVLVLMLKPPSERFPLIKDNLSTFACRPEIRTLVNMWAQKEKMLQYGSYVAMFAFRDFTFNQGFLTVVWLFESNQANSINQHYTPAPVFHQIMNTFNHS